jgi:hypothetical protein
MAPKQRGNALAAGHPNRRFAPGVPAHSQQKIWLEPWQQGLKAWRLLGGPTKATGCVRAWLVLQLPELHWWALQRLHKALQGNAQATAAAGALGIAAENPHTGHPSTTELKARQWRSQQTNCFYFIGIAA